MAMHRYLFMPVHRAIIRQIIDKFRKKGVSGMARKVANTVLDSRGARRKLKSRGRPYYRAVERGLHIGYRRAGRGTAGTWSARLYLGDGNMRNTS